MEGREEWKGSEWECEAPAERKIGRMEEWGEGNSPIFQPSNLPASSRFTFHVSRLIISVTVSHIGFIS